jgi:hypothetical protein
MLNCCKLKIALGRNIVKNNNISIQRILYSTSNEFNFPKNESFHYTQALLRKNFIKYKKQSILRVDHDHVYTDHERLPTLDERLKGILIKFEEKN